MEAAVDVASWIIFVVGYQPFLFFFYQKEIFFKKETLWSVSTDKSATRPTNILASYMQVLFFRLFFKAKLYSWQ